MSDELPKLFTDEELEALQKQRQQAEPSAHDILGAERIRPVHKATDGLPESTIEQMFPHIAKKLTLLWPSEACSLYIARLCVAERSGRQGFPLDVMEDLMMLREINDVLNAQPEPVQTAIATQETQATQAPNGWGEAVRREHD